MKNRLEHILLSILLGLSVLLGLSFWLDIIFNFNIFCTAHWNEFAKLQANQTPISIGFYMSFVVAIFIFMVGVYFIHRSVFKIIPTKKEEIATIQIKIPTKPDTTYTPETEYIEPVFSFERPPRLNLPNNAEQIAQQTKATQRQPQTAPQPASSENPYNKVVSEIFSNNGYTLKTNPTLSGFVPNLFAIGNNEVVWIGGIDCDIEKMVSGIKKLDSVFKETLEDIQININAFILDTSNKYDSVNTDLLIFKSIEDLTKFIQEHHADIVEDDDRESFDSYSEYIDTIIKYIKNI